MKISSYLTFNGNCREAMNFYRKCLGGELTIQTIGESPLSGQLPEPMKKTIVHSTLTRDGFVLMGTDMVGEDELRDGNTVSLLLDCSSEEEIRNIYRLLSEGGKVNQPVEVSFWGALFGDLTDKFGKHWLLHYQENND
jgi:PhnB protein